MFRVSRTPRHVKRKKKVRYNGDNKSYLLEIKEIENVVDKQKTVKDKRLQ